jgi:hypothetical protein
MLMKGNIDEARQQPATINNHLGAGHTVGPQAPVIPSALPPATRPVPTG